MQGYRLFKFFIISSVLLFVVIILAWGFILLTSKPKIISPLANSSRLKVFDSVWFPKIGSFQILSEKEKLDISAKAAFFVDTQTGEILFEKDPYTLYPIASLTKIMTAIITLENMSIDQVVKVSQRAADMEPDKMFLIGGEEMRVEDLLKGVFLISANDASEALAESATGRREEFINLMNSKAKQLGLNNTLFINPTGLQEDGKSQFSTAFEVAVMAHYAIDKWPYLLDISSKDHIYIERSTTHQDYDLYSGINLLTTYPGVMGFKTGYTPEAGLTLVTVARRGGHEVLGVLLGSTSRREDAKQLLDYSFKKLGVDIK